MDASFEITLLMVITIVAGIGAQVCAEFFKVPSIVFLLSFGILLGQDGLEIIRPSLLGNGLEVIVGLSVALILFEGGLSLELRELGKVSGSLRNLVTIGTMVTLVGGGMAAHWLSEFPWTIAFLYASIVVVTGPTVVGPLLKQVKVNRQVSTLLEGEGVLIDPVGAILAVVVLDFILNGSQATAPLTMLSGLTLRLGIGALIGVAGGWLLGAFLRRATFMAEDLKNLVVLAGVWGLFVLAQTIRSESGLMTMVMAGLTLRASALPEERLIRRFKGQLTMLAISVLFILLSADLSLASLLARLCQDRGDSVVIIDTDEAACRQAEEQQIHTFLSSAFDEIALEAAGVESTGTFLAMTSNGEVNLGVAQRVVEEFDPPRVLAVFPRDPQAATQPGNAKSSSKKINQAFAPELMLKNWNTYLNDGSVKLGQTRLRSLGLEFQKAHLNALIRSQELVPLLLERDETFQIVAAEDEWKGGDLIIYLLHDPKPALLKRLSGAKNPLRIAERVAIVEEVPIPLDLPKPFLTPVTPTIDGDKESSSKLEI